MVEQVASEVMEEIWDLWAEEAVMDHVHGLLQLWVGFIILPRLIAACASKMSVAEGERRTKGGREEREREQNR